VQIWLRWSVPGGVRLREPDAHRGKPSRIRRPDVSAENLRPDPHPAPGQRGPRRRRGPLHLCPISAGGSHASHSSMGWIRPGS
jgi:hypothetical protein